MEHPKPQIPAGAFISLASESIPIIDRIQIARCLWKFSHQSNKEQIILSSIISMIKSKKALSNEETSCLWQTLAEFLSSQVLTNFLHENVNTIEVDPPIEAYADALLQGIELRPLLDIAKILIFHKNINSQFKLKFQTVTRVLGSWILILNRLPDSSSAMHKDVLEFVTLLMRRVRSVLEEQSIKRGFYNIVEHCLIPLLNFHRKLSVGSEVFSDPPVARLLEDVLDQSLFSKDSLIYFTRAMTFEFEQWRLKGIPEENDEVKNKKLNDQSFHFWLKLSSLKHVGEMDAGVTTLYRLCVRATPGRKSFSFFTNLVGLLDVRRNEGHLETLHSLLMLNLKCNLYQPKVDEAFAELQHDCYTDLVEELLKLKSSFHWGRCLGTVAEIDCDAIDAKLPCIVDKLLCAGDDVTMTWMEAMLGQLFKVFNEMRKPLRVLAIFAQRLRHLNVLGDVNNYISVSMALGDAVSSQCSMLPSANVVLDIWDTVLREVSPLLTSYKEAQSPMKDHCSGEESPSVGDKRKIPQDGAIKRAKYDPTNLRCHLVILTRLVSVVDVLQLQLQLPVRKRFSQLLSDLRTLIFDLRTGIAVHYSDVIGQYYDLVVAVGRVHALMTRYGDANTSADITEFVSVKSLREIEIDSVNLSHRQLYSFNKWLCFKIDLLSYHLQQRSDDSTVGSDLTNTVLLLLGFVHVTTGSTWNGREAVIRDKDTLSIATVRLVKNSFHTISSVATLPMKTMSNLIVACHCERQSESDDITMVSPIRDLMTSHGFIENRHLHTSLLESCMELADRSLKESKLDYPAIAAVLNFAKRRLASITDDVNIADDVITMFSQRCEHQVMKDAFNRIIALLRHIPHQYFPMHEKHAWLALVTCALATLDDVEDCVTLADEIIGSKKSEDFASILPLRVAMPFLTSHFNKFSFDCLNRAHRVLHDLIRLELHSRDPTRHSFNNLIHKSISSDDESSVLPVIILMEPLFTLVHRQRGVGHTSRYVLLRQHDVSEQYFIDSLHLRNIIHPPRKDVIIDDITATVLQKCDLIMQGLLSLSKNYLKNNQAASDCVLAKLCLLASHTLDNSSCSKKESYLRELMEDIGVTEWINKLVVDVKSESDAAIVISKLQFVLAYLELQVNAATTAWGKTGMRSSWGDVLMRLVEGFTSVVVKTNRLCLMLLERCIVASLLLAPSVDEHRELFTRISLHPDLMIKLEMARMLASCYDVKRKQLYSILPDSGKDETVSDYLNIQVKYLRRSLEGAVKQVDSVVSSSSDHSEANKLADILTIASNLVELSALIKPRQASVVFLILVRLPLHSYLGKPGFPRLFFAFEKVFFAIISHHKMAMNGWIPLITSQCRKMADVTMRVGSQSYIQSDDSRLKTAVSCARVIQRIASFLAANYQSFFRNTAAYLLADYAHGLTEETLHPSVKEILHSAFNSIASITLDNDVAMLKTTLPPGVREVFRNFHEDYRKYFQYRGLV